MQPLRDLLVIMCPVSAGMNPCAVLLLIHYVPHPSGDNCHCAATVAHSFNCHLMVAMDRRSM